MKLIIVALGLMLTSCATGPKCRDSAGFNMVFEKSCKPRIRNVYVADQLSPELKTKLKDSPNLSVEWVPTEVVGSKIIPAHIAILNTNGPSQ